jgi:hypothetical protein
MRARIGMAMGAYWGGIMQAIDIIAMIAALGAMGSLPAVLSILTKYTSVAARRFACANPALCNKS